MWKLSHKEMSMIDCVWGLHREWVFLSGCCRWELINEEKGRKMVFLSFSQQLLSSDCVSSTLLSVEPAMLKGLCEKGPVRRREASLAGLRSEPQATGLIGIRAVVLIRGCNATRHHAFNRAPSCLVYERGSKESDPSKFMTYWKSLVGKFFKMVTQRVYLWWS